MKKLPPVFAMSAVKYVCGDESSHLGDQLLGTYTERAAGDWLPLGENNATFGVEGCKRGP